VVKNYSIELTFLTEDRKTGPVPGGRAETSLFNEKPYNNREGRYNAGRKEAAKALFRRLTIFDKEKAL
jgi:hypothetical protein